MSDNDYDYEFSDREDQYSGHSDNGSSVHGSDFEYEGGAPLYILHTDLIFFPKPNRRYQYSAPFFFLDEILILVPRPPK